MSKGLTIIDKDYAQWVEELCKRYCRSQLKAAVRVNREMLRFYWELGRDIVEMQVEQRWGEKVITTLSADLKQAIPGATGFSRINLYYTKRFYSLYSKFISVVPQPGEQLTSNGGIEIVPQLGEQFPTQVAELSVGGYLSHRLPLLDAHYRGNRGTTRRNDNQETNNK